MQILDEYRVNGVKDLDIKISRVLEKVITIDNDVVETKNEIVQAASSFTGKMMRMQKEILLTEMYGNRLQRSWRPVIMLAFGFVVVYEFFISKVFSLPTADLPSNYWDLLEIGLGGFVIGRSAEKITGAIAKSEISINRGKK